MGLVHNQQLHIPVNAAIESKVRHLGVDPVIFAVIHIYLQVVFRLQIGGDITAEGRVATVVSHNLSSVQADPGRGIDPLKLQIHLLGVTVKIGHSKHLAVAACAPLIVIAPVLPVQGVPGVGNIHLACLSVHIRKMPLLIQ